jgi:tetratricopeptide (TPR) repeat protein
MKLKTLTRRLPGPWLIVILLGSALSVLIIERRTSASLAADHFRAFVSRMQLTRYPKARLEIEHAVRLSPDNAYYASSFGLLEGRMTGSSFDTGLHLANKPQLDEQAKQHVEAAIRWYETALLLNRMDGSFHHNLGWLRCLLNQNDQALEHFRQALLLEPNNAMYRIGLGLHYERAGSTEDAVSEYLPAVRQSPAIVDSRFFSDFKQRWPSAAEEMVARAIDDLESRQKEDPVFRARLAKLYLYSGRPEAIETLKQITVELPSLSRPWLYLGILYERQRDNEEAKRCYDKSVFLGGDFSVLLQLGRLHDQADRTAEAMRYYQSAINSWLSNSSDSARRAARVYQTTDIVPDDILPRGFLSYVEPDFELRDTCTRLANLYRTTGNAEQANYFDELGKRSGLSPASLH